MLSETSTQRSIAASQRATAPAAAAPSTAPPKRTGGLWALLELVRSGAILPLRGTHILSLAKSKQPLPPRRDLPEEAFWTADQLSLLYTHLSNRFGDEGVLEGPEK